MRNKNAKRMSIRAFKIYRLIRTKKRCISDFLPDNFERLNPEE